MVEAEHAVVALHERHPGVPAHNARRGQRNRPGGQAAEAQRAGHLLLRPVNEQGHLVVGEAVGADVDFEAVFGGPERLDGMLVVVGGSAFAVVDLDERVWPAAPEDAGNEGESVARGGVNDLEVPALEEGRALVVQTAVIARRVQRVANKSNHALPEEGNHRFHRLDLLICEICVICGFFLVIRPSRL